MGLAKATLHNLETRTAIPVQFNPEQGYVVNSSNNFNQEPGRAGPPTVTFVGTQQRQLTMELFFDTTWQQRDVRESVQQVLALLERDTKTDAPPRLLFTWGSLQFRCVLQSVNQRYTLFLGDGRPSRAYLDVTLLEAESTTLQAPEFAAPSTGTVVPVSQGETLSHVAARTMSDPRRWRELAVINNIANPRKLTMRFALILSTK